MIVWAMFDEIDTLYTICFTIGLYAVMILSAYAFMRSTRMLQRVLALGTGVLITVVAASMGSTLYWLEPGWIDTAGMIKAVYSIIVVMFAPAFIGILRYADNPYPSEWKN